MKNFYVIFAIISFLILTILGTMSINAQPVTNLERGFGLEQKIQMYKYSESFGGSDSAWINLNKRTREFNLSNQVETFYQMKWDSIDWKNEMMWTYEYNGNLLTSLNNYSWGDEVWNATGKFEFEYDSEQRNIKNINYSKNEDDEWIVSSVTSTSYNENGQVLDVTNYRNQGFNADTTRTVYTYDMDGNLIELFNQKIGNNEWVNVNVIEFHYENSLLISQEYKFWYGSEQYNDFIDSMYYDEFGRNISRIHYKFYDDEYSMHSRFMWTYDENDNIIEEIFQNWFGIRWDDPLKTEITYDDKGNLVQRLKQQFRNDVWNNKDNSNFTYNSDNQLTEFAYYIWIVDDWQRNVRFIYDHAAVDVNDYANKFSQIMNYPNPFSVETTIRFSITDNSDATITIYDIRGQIINSENLIGLKPGITDYKFNSSGLASGIYIYQIEAGGEQYFNSFVINR